MKNLSTPMLLKLIFIIIILVIVFVFITNLLGAANLSGRFTCKFAYAIAAPLSLFMDINTAAASIGKSLIVASTIAIAFGIATAVAAIAVKCPKVSNFLEQHKTTGAVVNFLAKASTITSNVIYWRLTELGLVSGLSLSAFGSVVNGALRMLQGPIVQGLCKPAIVLITANEWDEAEIDKCVKDIARKEIKNPEKKRFIRDIVLPNRNLKFKVCLAFYVADAVRKTYGETLGTKVRIPFSRVHYMLFVNLENAIESNVRVTLADVQAVLDLLEIEENKSYYRMMYGEREANSRRDGDIYAAYKNFMRAVYNNYYFDTDENSKNLKIASVFCADECRDEYKNREIFNEAGEYILMISYPGIDAISIFSKEIK